MSRLTNKFSGDILGFLLVIITLISCTPILAKPTYYIGMGIAIAIMVVVNLFTRCYQRNSLLITCVFLYIALNFIYRFLNISDARWGHYFYLFSFVYILLMLQIPNKLTSEQKKCILWLILIIMTFNVVDNIRICILYPTISSRRFDFDQEFLGGINAGGTIFFTFALMFFNVCFFVFLNCKRKIVKYVMFGITILTSVYILRYCLKASVVFYFFLSVVLIFCGKTIKKTFLFMTGLIILFVFVFIFVQLFSDELIDLVKKISPAERLTRRLITLIDFDSSEAYEGTITGRRDLYLLSLKTWLKSPANFIFGVGEHFTLGGGGETGIGQHADLLDLAGKYGMIGIILVYYIFKSSIKFVLSMFDKKYHFQVLLIFVIFILAGLTKTIFTAAISCVLFILLPLSAEFVNDKSCKFVDRYPTVCEMRKR